MASASNDDHVYHGDFPGQVKIEIERVDQDGRTTVDITTPKLERVTTPSSSSSITESEKIKKEPASGDETPELDTVRTRKERISKGDEDLEMMDKIPLSKNTFSPLLYTEEYDKFTMRTEQFMRAFGKACRVDIHGGILSEKTMVRLTKILLVDKDNDKLNISLINLFYPIHNYFASIKLLGGLKMHDRGNIALLKRMYNRMHDVEWFDTKPFQKDVPEASDVMVSFNEHYTFYVMQAINRMLIAKKIKSHTISGRYIMRCIFTIVTIMIFPNIDEPETCFDLHEQIRGKEMEIKMLGRNVWLRKAWTMFISIIKTDQKRVIYPEVKDTGDALTFNDLMHAYTAVINEYNSVFAQNAGTSKPNTSNTFVKKSREYRSIIGIMHCTFYCLDFYNIITGYLHDGEYHRFDYDIFHRITHPPWLWPKYRGDLEQSEITEKLLTSMDSSDYNSLYDDSKHLHSFRSSRTFGVRLHEKYFRFYDGQDVAAGIRDDTQLGIICIDIGRQFGIYDAYNADLSKTQGEVNDQRDLLYIKMTDLRNAISAAIREFVSIKSSNDIPDFQSRAQIYDLSADDDEKTIEKVRWIKVDHDNPEAILAKVDHQEKIEGAEDGISVTPIDKKRKHQARKAIYIDSLAADIQIAQSLLRYLEQVYGVYYPESKRFF